MMKKLFALLLFALSFSAGAVDTYNTLDRALYPTTYGTSGYCWTSNGIGVVPSWQACSGGGGGGTPGGSTGDIQTNAGAGAFGGITPGTGVATGLATAVNTTNGFVTPAGNVATATALAANPTDCSSNQFANAIAANGNLTCAALTLAGAQFANQGTTTTLLHGNGAGNPSFAAVGSSDLSASLSLTTPNINAATGSSLTLATGGAVRTSTSAGNTTLLQAYDVDGGSYTTFGTLTANNTPTFDLSASTTVGGGPLLSVASVAQGDLFYGTGVNTISTLAKDTNATRYLSNTGSSNAPAWAQVAVSTGISGFGTGIATALAVNTGSAGAPVLFNGALGTPSSGTLSSATGLPISTGVSGLGTGVATALAATANGTGGLVTDSGTVTLTNKRITARVVSMSDATSITPTGDTANVNTQANTQSVGTLTVNAPSGTPTDLQGIMIRIKSTNVQTYSWNAIYRGSTSAALPTASTGGGKTDYLCFTYNAADTKWDYSCNVSGF